MKFLALILAPLALAQNFQDSCREIKAVNQYLSAICQGPGGTETCSEVDLTSCLLNVGGKLVYADDVASGTGYAYYDVRNGDLSRTGCKQCSSSTPFEGQEIPTLLHCSGCPDGRSYDEPAAQFDLNTVVSNEGGKLTCLRSKAAVRPTSYCESKDVNVYV
ncbi:uncharacterized protein DNG_01777 [Cephalotrichum gorgonifer]|uniref:Cyanovirin-N domain-containing protein n=1 Tax=Cephalotrichum gorgonifer TaxID=2041049 RepID=A0AAE8MRF2_9PEZI|nr:uncharacterized protein DNG_01777 [Cephalotrichum gorgonifer]